MQPETKFKEKVQRLLKAVPMSHWIKIQSVAIRGIPDIIGVVNGRFVALELKVPPNKVKPGSLQEWWLMALANAGAYARELNPNNLQEVLADLHKLGDADAFLHPVAEKPLRPETQTAPLPGRTRATRSRRAP